MADTVQVISGTIWNQMASAFNVLLKGFQHKDLPDRLLIDTSSNEAEAGTFSLHQKVKAAAEAIATQFQEGGAQIVPKAEADALLEVAREIREASISRLEPRKPVVAGELWNKLDCAIAAYEEATGESA